MTIKTYLINFTMTKNTKRTEKCTTANKSIANSGAGRWRQSAAYRYSAFVRAGRSLFGFLFLSSTKVFQLSFGCQAEVFQLPHHRQYLARCALPYFGRLALELLSRNEIRFSLISNRFRWTRLTF